MCVSIVLRCDLFLTVDCSQEYEEQSCLGASVAHGEVIAMERECIVIIIVII